MANSIINFKGNNIGRSIKEDNCEIIIKEIFETSKKHSCVITFPEDVLVGKNLDDQSQIKEISNIEDDDLILDIGPRTIQQIKNIIEISKTVLWNGPAGYFETQILPVVFEIAKAIIKKKE